LIQRNLIFHSVQLPEADGFNGEVLIIDSSHINDGFLAYTLCLYRIHHMMLSLMIHSCTL